MSAVASPSPVSQDTASSWERLRANEDIQFAPVELPQQAPSEPNFIERFFQWLGEIFAETLGRALIASWPVLQWVLLAALIAAVIYMLWQLFDPLNRGERSQADLEEEPEWRPDQGAATTCWAATSPELEGKGGVYCEDCHVAENDDESSAGGVRSYAIEPDIADQLWSISEQMTGESFSA